MARKPISMSQFKTMAHTRAGNTDTNSSTPWPWQSNQQTFFDTRAGELDQALVLAQHHSSHGIQKCTCTMAAAS